MKTRPALPLATLLLLTALLALCACGAGSSGPTLQRASDLAGGLAGVGTLPAPASAWPEAGYDARYSSGTSAVGPQSAHVRWTRALGGTVTPGPVLGADGGILAATNAGVLHDLDPATGKDRWTYDGGGSYGSDLSTSPAVLSGGTILWPGPRDTLYALTERGRLQWTQHFAGQVLSPAVAGAGRVYVADLAGHLSAFAITATSHRLVWRLDVGGPDYASASVGPDGTIYTADDHDLVAVRDLGAKGVIAFRLTTKKLVEVSNGVSAAGTVVLGTNHDREFGVAADGSVRWSFDVGDYTYSSAVVRPDGTAYFGDNTGRLRVLNSKTGKVEATLAPLGNGAEKIWTTATVDARGDFYWGTTEGNVYGYTRTDTPLWHLKVDGIVQCYPALGGDGTLYLGTTAGTFYAIGR